MLEYIQSTGSQYINTGIKVVQNTNIETAFQYTGNLSTAFDDFFGVTYEGSAAKSVLLRNRAGGFECFFGKSGGTGADFDKHTLSIKSSGFYLDDTLLFTKGSLTTQNITMPIFATNQNGTIQNKGHFKVFYFKIYNNTTLVRDFVPVKRISDKAVGLYDKVNNKLYTRSGSGSFITGKIIGGFWEWICTNAGGGK